MMRIKAFGLILTCLAIGLSACVKNEVSFTARSDMDNKGNIGRKGSLEIRISGDRDISEDSLKLTQFYNENYIVPDESLFDYSLSYGDSTLAVSWKGDIARENMPVSDYVHKSREGSAAINSISVIERNRWIFRDISYTETFSDPVDSTRYFPLIRQQLSKASGSILDDKALKGIGNREGAEKLLGNIETVAGIDLFKKILENPAAYDTVSSIYDDQIYMVSDSLAGFAGVKQNPDSLNRLIHDVYDAAWDTLLSDYPGLFGSFAFDDINIHDFRIEVVAPGCIIKSNSDTTISGAQVWSFNRLDFFARHYTIEMVARNWQWFNIAITVIAIAIILFVILGPVRKSRAE